MDIQNAYNQWSESYDHDENRTRDLDRDVIRKLLGSLQFDSILEIGCGTGKNTSFLVQIGQKVEAVDFSPGMIAKAREKVQVENVNFSQMDINEPWKFTGEAFDLVVCNLVLEHIQDLDHVFSEAARVLRPGGKYFIDELHPFRQYEGTKARFYKSEETIEVDAFIHHVSDFLNTAAENHLSLIQLGEYWHATDQNRPPRILSLYFGRR